MKKIIKAFLSTLLFIIFLFIVYYIHITFFQVNVVFYSAILDGLIAALITYLVIIFSSYFKLFNGFEKLQLIIIWILGGYIFAISVPTVIDRSLSFYILEKIQQRNGGILQSEFEKVFTQEYVKEHRLVDVRLTEQESSGTIKIENGCVMLTSRGEYLATFSRYFRQNFLPKHRLLMGEYTDVLTDPFAHGSIDENITFNYLCDER
jgi:hypothetical protein